MSSIILRTNAAPIYSFLSLIESKRSSGELEGPLKILDCGAGGPVPPLALFSELGYQACGIDISDDQLDLARKFCQENRIQVDFRQADMRQIPFSNSSFDCVYENYSICHLSHQGTAAAIAEIHRVTRDKGFCLLGLISSDTWPKSLFGEEREPGEYWDLEDGEETRHSIFTDQESDQLVADWEITSKIKQIMYLRQHAREMSQEDWMELKAGGDYSDEEWRVEYQGRENRVTYVHTYYTLRK